MIPSENKAYRYSAFGISIASAIEMPEFPRSAAPADVFFRYGDVPVPLHDCHGPVRGVGAAGDGILMYWSTVGAFLIEHGRTVTVSPARDADPAYLRLVLNGPVLAVLLAQRGSTVFHASVVQCPATGGAVAFAARSGGGKSTMAGAAYNAGYLMVSDDVLAVDIVNNVPFAQPGFPHAKLWTSSAEALVEDAGALTRLASSYEKLGRPISERFASEPARLAAVFVLDDGPEIVISRLSGHSALGALLPHWYGARFDGQLVRILGIRRHLRETTMLANRTAVYRLTRPRLLGQLPEVVTAVEKTIMSARDLKCEESACRS